MGAQDFRFPGLAKRARAKYALLIGPIRVTAEKCGYAIGVHGSLARDIDLIAVPWRRDAVSGNELAERIVRCVKRLLGKAKRNPKAMKVDDWWEKKGALLIPTEKYFRHHVVGPGLRRRRKPHGRRCWSIHLGGGPYIDLSIMPRRR